MVKTRKERIADKSIKFKQPDRSAPTEKTLLQFADERSLFEAAEEREKELKKERGEASDSDEEDGDVLSPTTERFLEAMLWTTTLAMLHFTFDVFVQNQYGTRVDWPLVGTNTVRAWIVFLIFFYPLHPHEANPILIPGIPQKYQKWIRQAIFFVMSCLSGCYLIYVTNAKGYLYNMKRAPPLACLWLWAVVELDLAWAVLSLAVAAGFLIKNDYKIK
ncbi:hypothetical protein PT974_05001 [Cladobotryum mycophilum]|uniref:DUF7719 domain-containing protein n=1 Tax=Cladobotryum mycophilum TaxID=491253 RepID=A0ABR0SQX5_9HYPO